MATAVKAKDLLSGALGFFRKTYKPIHRFNTAIPEMKRLLSDVCMPTAAGW
jgi:hypothetical protein